MKKSSIISFDFGMKSIGVAIGQFITCTAYPLTALKANNGVPDWIQVEKLLKEWNPKLAVIGLPLNMNGTEQLITTHTRKFSDFFKNRFNINTVLHDERLSTIEARENLFKNNGYSALEKKK